MSELSGEHEYARAWGYGVLGYLGDKGKKYTPAHQEAQNITSHGSATQPPGASPADPNPAPLSQDVPGTLPCTQKGFSSLYPWRVPTKDCP